jgi:hypothetical protein
MSDPGGNSGNNSKMHPRDRGVDEQETLRRQLEAFQSGLWTAMPVIMKKHNSDANTVGVQPAIKLAHAQPDGQLKWLQIPELHDLPIQYYGGGGATIVPPMKEGDEGLVVFASRTMDKWWQQGGVQEQTEARMHDLSDGWFLPGGRSQPRKLKDINPNEWQLRTDDGKKSIVIWWLIRSIKLFFAPKEVNQYALRAICLPLVKSLHCKAVAEAVAAVLAARAA